MGDLALTQSQTCSSVPSSHALVGRATAALGAQEHSGAVHTDAATELKAGVLRGPLSHTVLQVMHVLIQISSAFEI